MAYYSEAIMHQSQGHYISSIYRHLQIYLNNKFANLGFGSGQYLFFNHIANNEGITQKELSRLLAIDKATTAKAIKKLIALGYVQAVAGEDDKRFLNLFLTDRGREILPEVRSVLRDTRGILQRNLSENEIKLSLKIMDRMLTNITDEVKPEWKNNDR